MLTVVLEDWLYVVTVNVAMFELAGTVTVAGTVATEEFEVDSNTTVPPDGAGPESVTVPVRLLPPTAVVGATATALTVSDEEVPGVMVTGEPSFSPFRLAAIITVAFDV